MKKQLLYLFLSLTLISCSTDVKFNSPAFEGQKDNVFWRAVDSKASIGSGGSLIIEAYTRNEIITLKTAASNPGTYVLGTGSLNTASYVLKDAVGTLAFATGDNIGDGRIVITEYDAVNKTVSGTFKFNAENIYNNPLAGPVLNFQYGHFYKTPVSTSASSVTPLPGMP